VRFDPPLAGSTVFSPRCCDKNVGNILAGLTHRQRRFDTKTVAADGFLSDLDPVDLNDEYHVHDVHDVHRTSGLPKRVHSPFTSSLSTISTFRFARGGEQFSAKAAWRLAFLQGHDFEIARELVNLTAHLLG
jgi:hypothetical protein